MKDSTFSSLKLVLTSMTGAALLASCNKKDSVSTIPAAQTAPVPTLATSAETTATPPALSEAASSNKVAIEAFKSEIKGIKAFMEKNQGASDPVAALANLRELIKRAAAVNTVGLPEDLSSAYTSMTKVMQSVQETLDDLPVPVDQLQKYTDSEKAKGAAAAEEVMAKRAAFETAMATHQTEGESATAKLKEVGAKYGIEALDLGGK